MGSAFGVAERELQRVGQAARAKANQHAGSFTAECIFLMMLQNEEVLEPGICNGL